jgi:hypothetical protein
MNTSDEGSVSRAPAAVTTTASASTTRRPVRSASRPASEEEYVPVRYTVNSAPTAVVGRPKGAALTRNVR